MIKETEKLTLDDLTIIPAATSYVLHRSDCNPYYNIEGYGKFLPVMAAPMGALINERNYTVFSDNGITPVIPRTVSGEIRLELLKKDAAFVALSLEEAKMLFDTDNPAVTNKCRICIDMAQGHLSSLYECIFSIKQRWGSNVTVMSGNIANPDAYEMYCKVRCDYVRVGIGNGSQCTTSCLTAVHYPLASLLDDISHIREKIVKDYTDDRFSDFTDRPVCTKIVADGGIKSYADIIKALGLGADYVMVGKPFAHCTEAAEPIYQYTGKSLFPDYVPEASVHYYSDKDYIPKSWKRKYYGMSTHKAQQLINENSLCPSPDFKLKGEEGISEEIEVNTTLKAWINGFTDAFRSAMSYADCNAVSDFGPAKVNFVKISNRSFAFYQKKF